MDKLALSSNDQQGRLEAGALALHEVEQEREVEVQVEQVRQVEKRERLAALKFPGMHPNIMQFARTGKLEVVQSAKGRKSGFEHAYTFVGRTSIGRHFGVHETSSKLFVSREFANTVNTPIGSQEGNNFLVSEQPTRLWDESKC
jgi:hypothetical protein